MCLLLLDVVALEREGAVKRMTVAVVALAAFASLAVDAQAAHCSRLSKAFGDLKKISAQVDKAEARDDMDATCELQKRYVALARATLGNTRTECFHGGRKAFETALAASQALEELYCEWDDDWDDDDF